MAGAITPSTVVATGSLSVPGLCGGHISGGTNNLEGSARKPLRRTADRPPDRASESGVFPRAAGCAGMNASDSLRSRAPAAQSRSSANARCSPRYGSSCRVRGGMPIRGAKTKRSCIASAQVEAGAATGTRPSSLLHPKSRGLADRRLSALFPVSSGGPCR